MLRPRPSQTHTNTLRSFFPSYILQTLDAHARTHTRIETIERVKKENEKEKTFFSSARALNYFCVESFKCVRERERRRASESAYVLSSFNKHAGAAFYFPLFGRLSSRHMNHKTFLSTTTKKSQII